MARCGLASLPVADMLASAPVIQSLMLVVPLFNPPDLISKFKLIWFFSITNYEVNYIRVATMQVFCLFPVLQLPRCRLDAAHVSRATPRHPTRDDFSGVTEGNVLWCHNCHTPHQNMEMEKSK